MEKLYAKNEVLFAVVWILVYCLALTPIRAKLGDTSPWMTLALLLLSSAAFLFIRSSRLTEKYGLNGWPKNTKRFLFFLPMWILATGNLWGGIAPRYSGMPQAFAVCSMILVGFAEEVLFRGFLFRALLKENSTVSAVVISALTFAIGHIINLFSGQATLDTLVQIAFAAGWGFIFTMVTYKSGSLLPAILAHAMIDVFSVFCSSDSEALSLIYSGLTVAVAVCWCIILAKQPQNQPDDSGQ